MMFKNKKLIIISIVLFVGIIIGIICYVNSPGYVLKQYIKTYNNGDFNKLEKYEYSYGRNKLMHTNECQRIIDYKLHYKGNDERQIEIDIGVNSHYYDDKKISYIYTYLITQEDASILTKITIGKVDGKWKVVKSPFYSPYK